ncbi:MAG: NAD(P)-dependent alcohol dehydrogenase [Burkholderiales bacterium]
MNASQTMRAAVTHDKTWASLNVQSSLALPRPQAGEVLLKVRAVSLNYRDLLMINARVGLAEGAPFVPGSDASGEVVAVGEGVTRWRVGDRLTTTYMRGWHRGAPTVAQRAGNTLGGPLPGVLQEYVVVTQDDAVRTPEGWSDEEASTLPIAALTAWTTLTDGGLRPGCTVVTQGSGGVALFALQFAKAAGARVIAISSTDEKRAHLQRMGADLTIDRRANPQWQTAVREATGGIGADIVVETTGATLQSSIASCALGGFVGVVGFVGGAQADVSMRSLIASMVRVHGILVGSRDGFESMVAMLKNHAALRPVIDSVFTLDQVVPAFKRQQSGEQFGKIVVRL